jgi:hypothetical protein
MIRAYTGASDWSTRSSGDSSYEHRPCFACAQVLHLMPQPLQVQLILQPVSQQLRQQRLGFFLKSIQVRKSEKKEGEHDLPGEYRGGARQGP